MINKKGSLVLRDVVFIMLIMSSIFVLAGLFVSEMAFNYQNTDMSDEWALTGTNTLANSTFQDTTTELENIGNEMNTGIISLIGGLLTGIGDILIMTFNAPETIAGLVYGVLLDIGAAPILAVIIYNLIKGLMWIIIGFTVYSAFLRGGKL